MDGEPVTDAGREPMDAAPPPASAPLTEATRRPVTPDLAAQVRELEDAESDLRRRLAGLDGL